MSFYDIFQLSLDSIVATNARKGDKRTTTTKALRWTFKGAAQFDNGISGSVFNYDIYENKLLEVIHVCLIYNKIYIFFLF